MQGYYEHLFDLLKSSEMLEQVSWLALFLVLLSVKVLQSELELAAAVIPHQQLLAALEQWGETWQEPFTDHKSNTTSPSAPSI